MEYDHTSKTITVANPTSTISLIRYWLYNTVTDEFGLFSTRQLYYDTGPCP